MLIYNQVDFGSMTIIFGKPIRISEQDELAIGQASSVKLELNVNDAAAGGFAISIETAIGGTDGG